jgi:DNA gyrase subunit A
VVSQQGFGKRTAIDEYRITNRGGKGVKTINVTEKTGSLVGIMDVLEKDDLIITCKSGVTIRTNISEIREAGRATQGVKLIRLDEGDEIAATSKIADQDEPDLEMVEGETTATDVIIENGAVSEDNSTNSSDSTDTSNITEENTPEA